MLVGPNKHFLVRVKNSRGAAVKGYEIKLTGDAKFDVNNGILGAGNTQNQISTGDGLLDFIGVANAAGPASLTFLAVDDNQVNNNNAPWTLQINAQ